jgi:hypothetical protein
MSEGVVLRDRALIEMIDFPMPQKPHTEIAEKRPSFFEMREITT